MQKPSLLPIVIRLWTLDSKSLAVIGYEQLNEGRFKAKFFKHQIGNVPSFVVINWKCKAKIFKP